MKKILSLILAGLMSLSCAAFVAADDAAAETAADPLQEYAIEFLEGYGIYKGGEGLTDADLIQRYQMALFVARVSTGWVDDYKWDYNYDWEDNTANNSTFSDLAGTPAESYYGAISYANQMGIIEGYSATKFGPTDGITYRDALTMVCRTLGYKGLAYPWGYIQTAVELGLTKGIDAVYTEELTRGEVAVILYNAMFVNTKNGETLAKSIFDVDFGWKNIMIVSTDEGYFPNGAADAKAVNGKTTVGFKEILADRTLVGPTYYVPAEELGLSGHDEELALGSVYAALFTEKNGKLVELKKAVSLEGKPVVNNGITDDEGTPVNPLPIAAFISNYSLLKQVVGGEYLTVVGDDLFIYGDLVDVTVYGVDYNRIAIDVTTGNIIKWNGDGVAAWTEESKAGDYEVLWYYNELLGRYYRYEYNDGTDEIHVDWMSDEEFAKSWEDAIKCVLGTAKQYGRITDAAALNNPYAKLRIFDTDMNNVADLAMYKDYAIGYFSNGTAACNVGNVAGVNHSNTQMPTYNVVDLDADKDLIVDVHVFVEDGHAYHEAAAGYQFAWINVADSVVGFKNENGTYNNGVVLYDYNAMTGELEIVKYIPKNAAGTDADSGYAYGLLQGYSTRNATLTIDGETYKFGYDSLVGGTLKYNAGHIVNRKYNAIELDKCLMQYVEVLIVDGLVVDIDLVGEVTNGDAIVVLGYAGITSDGYIAVYGYDTTDAVLKLWKINSYNGWKKGDYRYNPLNAFEDEAFVKGTIYEIVSHDAATDSYGVETTSLEDWAATGTAVAYTFDSGYRVSGETYTKAKSSDTYIIVTDDGTIYAYVGIAPDTYRVTGTEVVSGDRRVIYAAAEDVVGFTDNANDIGFVLYSKANGRVLEAAYDEAQGVEKFYLLGSTLSEVNVFNVLTGAWDVAFTANNIDLVDGAYYMTIGNTLVERVSDINKDGIINTISKYYASEDFRNAKYFVMKDVEIDGSKAVNYQIAEELGVLPEGKNQAILNDIAAAYVPAAKIVVYSITADGEVSYDKFAIAADATYTADVIYDGVNTIIYIQTQD